MHWVQSALLKSLGLTVQLLLLLLLSQVIPTGYSVNLLGLGFNSFRSIVYRSGDEVIEVKTKKDIPSSFLFDVVYSRLNIGETALDTCRDAGLYDSKEDECICPSGECGEMHCDHNSPCRPKFTIGVLVCVTKRHSGLTVV